MDLSDLAVEYSLCPSKENGGMLGWIRRGQTVISYVTFCKVRMALISSNDSEYG